MIQWILNHWFISLLIANYATALSAAFFLIKSNQSPRKTTSSLLFLIAFPFIGLLIYYFFGLEYRKSKIFKRKDLRSNSLIKKWDDKLSISKAKLEEYEKTFLDDRIKLVKLMRHNQNASLTLHNDVAIIKNGETKFKMLFEDFSNAKHHIHIEYFVIVDDIIGTEFIDSLCDAAKRGVQVRLIYDSVGSSLSRKSKQQMTSAGVNHFAFMPVIFSNLTRKANYRDHRKIAIIDGKVGYVGGINVSDDYINETSNTKKLYWRDTHLRIEGHAVKSLQIQWLLNWYFVCNNSDKTCDVNMDMFPDVDTKGTVPVQIAASGPDTDWANIMEALFIAINSAEKTVRITTPYFIPNESILTAIESASRSGVKVEIMIPKRGDSWAARYAGRSYFKSVLDSGADIYWYTKGMLHAKTMVVDSHFATVGTTNMDYRSFDINFEINALIYDADKAKELEAYFIEDIKDCDKLDPERWRNRNKLERFKESFCRLWAPLL